MSSRAKSSSSAEGPQAVRAFQSVRPGDVIAGFRLERLLGRGETGAVYEATQLSLGRAVALRLIDPASYAGPEALARLDEELGRASSLHHPGLVPLFESGRWDGGRFLAMRLVPAGTLDALRPAAKPRDGSADLLEPVSSGLEAAHRAGLTHGAVRAANVLIDRDGRAYLADLGLGRGAGVEADRQGLADLRESLGTPGSRRRQWKALVAAGILAAAVAVALLVRAGSGDESAEADEPAPPAPEGTVSLGSSLSPGPAERAGCGGSFGGGSACVLVPAVEGRPLRATESGVIRAWAVRGAAGMLTLQVLRPRGKVTRGIGFSQPVEVSDPGPQRFPVEIGLDRGDLIAVELGPRAALGRRPGEGGALRWASTVLPQLSLSEATPLAGELLVRVDVEPGARPPVPEQLNGGRALAASEGTSLAEITVAVTPSDAVQVSLVRVDGRIHLDAFRGNRRTARVPLADADPEGELVLFEQSCGYRRSVCVRWRNPGTATPRVHAFSVTSGGRFRVIG